MTLSTSFQVLLPVGEDVVPAHPVTPETVREGGVKAIIFLLINHPYSLGIPITFAMNQ